jgi:hypothetical protein
MGKFRRVLPPLVLPRWLQQDNEILARRDNGEMLVSRREWEEMFAAYRETGKIPFGPEWNYLVSPCDIAQAQEMFPLLVRSAYRAGVLYQRGREREGAKAALEAILAFLQSVRTFELVMGDAPLRSLLRALEGLERGAVEPMLQPKNLAGSRMSPRSMLVRGHAAAIAELTRRSGHPLPKSCDLVADRLHVAGYHLTADGRRAIAGPTIRGWRRRVLTSGDGDPIRDVFRRVCRTGSGVVDFGTPRRGVDDLINELRSYVVPHEV